MGDTSSMKRPRLLVLDDEPEVCEFVKEAAEELDFEVDMATDVDAFHASYRMAPPDVVVLDLMLPDVDGIEILRFLAEQNFGAHVLLISGLDTRVLTSARQLGEARGLRMLGALEKPILLHDLQTALGRVLPDYLLVTEQELAEAIERKQVAVHYQPKIDLTAGRRWRVIGAEALVRWEHERYGTLMPKDFVPLAERTGLIAPLTELVLGTAVAQLRSWQDDGLSLSVAVNLSPRLLDDTDLPNRLSELLNRHGVTPSALLLEITESAASDDDMAAMDILTRIRLKGVGLSLDDFGTGASSLVRLHRLPFSELKIDKSFVVEMAQSQEASTIVRSIVGLAHNLGLKACAEGVESEETLDFLRSLDCDTAQGNHIGRAMAAAELARIIGGSGVRGAPRSDGDSEG